MTRFGTLAREMRPMSADDILMLRLNLLIIMTKAYLKGNPLGDFRKAAIKENARYVFYEALNRCRDTPQGSEAHQPPPKAALQDEDRLFLERIQLLAIMANTLARGKAMGTHRKRAMTDNINLLCDRLSDKIQLANAKFLKVA